MIIVWGTCAILTATDVLPENDAARTDLLTNIVDNSKWFRVPYPCKIKHSLPL